MKNRTPATLGTIVSSAIITLFAVPTLVFASIGYSQTITFNALSNKLTTDADFTVSATASSALAVTFASLTPATCTVTASTVHIVSAGSCSVEASQAGGSGYNAATPVTQSFTISAPAPVTSGGGGGGNGPIMGSITGFIGSIIPSFGQVLGVSTSTASTTSTTIHHVTLTHFMRIGSRDSQVTELQQFLISMNLLGIQVPTGYFGPLTRAAVIEYQRTHGIPATGNVFNLTINSINGITN